MKRETENRTDCFREAENYSQETRQPLSEQLQILNEAQFQLAVWFPGDFSYLSFHELLSFFNIISPFQLLYFFPA